jgi:DNA-binding response OmpR family regulator
MAPNGSPVVLVVEDDDDVRTTYEIWLDDDWEIRTAPDGAAALAALDASVDVVLLDRMMSGLSGREVLDVIRQREVDPRVVMVTAVEPDVDVVEMAFDAYLTKPVEKDELDETVRTMLERREYDDRLQEYYALVEKRATLEAKKTGGTLADDERYAALTRRIEELEAELGSKAADAEGEEFVALFDEAT